MDAIEYINSFDKFGIKLGLERMKKLMEYLHNPEQKFKSLHIAGTNGKGSTSAILAAIYKEAGYKVGAFNSPHIITFNERIKINGDYITDKDLAQAVEVVKQAVNKVSQELDTPTYFEVLTAIAIYYFASQEIDLAIFEVGLGGRLDATNVIDSEATIITNIDYDHTEYLGETIAEIAREKAGIIKSNNQFSITAAKQPEAVEEITEVCREKDVKLITVRDKINYSVQQTDKMGQIFNLSYDDKEYKELRLPLLGKYQIMNAALAIATAEELAASYPVSAMEIKQGLFNVRWPGRFEIVKQKPLVILDGAHNKAAANNIKGNLNYLDYNKLFLICSILKDKDISAILSSLVPLANRVIISENSNPRVAEIEIIATKLQKYNVTYESNKNLLTAINKTLEMAEEKDLILITGSLYTVMEARRSIME